MSMTTMKIGIRVLAVVALLGAVSCEKELGGPTGASDNASVTSAAPEATATPAAAPAAPSASAARARVRPVRDGLPVAIETAPAQPSPAVLEAVSVERAKLDGIAASVPGTSVRFVDCAGATCTSRLEAKSITALRDLLQAISKEQGGISFVAREQLDAYTGQTFVADVSVGGDHARPIPTDENELLVNNAAP
jgi:hypothetical protein